MDLKDLVMVVSPILTFCAVIISWLTLREISKQRKESYKPRLMFQNKTYFLQKNSNITPCFIKESHKNDQSIHCPDFTVELKNIGLGAAHSIQIEWLYNHRNILKLFTEFSKKTQLVKMNSDNHFEYLFDQNNNEGFGFHINPSNEESFDFASLASNESIPIKVPDTIQRIISFGPYLNMCSHQSNRVEFNFSDLL